ncbi:MAG: hypothetical protein H7X97_09380 [Opitutaceae bacterium]|nr:hypothetical protein [Verrucomicrobiales bacterium]
MNLTDVQKSTVGRWIEDGAKLADIQKRLDTELGVRLTYMEVRFLVDDLKLTPKDPVQPTAPEPAPALATAPPPTAGVPPNDPGLLGDLAPLPSGQPVKVGVDKIAKAGAMVSGSVTFSDGQIAEWYLDQMGRLGLAAKTKGYKPSAPDLEVFQMELQTELQKLGF